MYIYMTQHTMGEEGDWVEEKSGEMIIE